MAPTAARFCYWSNELRTKFNRAEYIRFRDNAVHEAKIGNMYGMQCLFRFYSYGLEVRFDSSIFQDFQDMVLLDCIHGYRYGIEKLQAFIQYSGMSLEVLPALKRYMM